MTAPAGPPPPSSPPSPPPAPRRRRPPTPRQSLILVLAVVVITAVVAVLVVVLNPHRCDEGLRDIDGSCIGVTASSDFEDPDLTAVMARIADQNTAATSGGDFYSVGYLLPLEPPAHRTSLSGELLHELQGAAVAQATTNKQAGGTKIKLMVANAGPDNVQWQVVTSSLRAAAAGPDRLRAVAGLGNSLADTRRAIQALTQSGTADGTTGPVATIGTRLTADSLSTDPTTRQITGFARIAPTNRDEAATAVGLIRQRKAVRPMLVSDKNANDDYVVSLGREFRDSFPNAQLETFDGHQDALPNAFETVTLDLCASSPDAVYFAGRGDALAAFVRKLADRTCGGTPIAVYTGDDVAGLRDALLANDPAIRAALKNVTVTYTGLASRDLWSRPDVLPTVGAGAVADLTAAHLDLGDGAAIMGNDAVFLAVTAIRRAAGPDQTPVTTSAVVQTLNAVHGQAAIAGASGRISLSSCGDAEGKLFPILTMTSSGTSTLVGPAYATNPPPC